MSHITKNKILHSVLILMSVIVTVFAIVIAYILLEIFFFDRVIYQKSGLHGYYAKPVSTSTYDQLPTLLRNRIHDSWLVINNKLEESDSVLTVAILGDSFAYGLGVQEKYVFSNLLAHSLSKYGVRVLNISQNGDSFFDNYKKYDLLEKTGEVDIYIFGMVNNDLIQNPQSQFYDSKTIEDIRVKYCDGLPLFTPINTHWESNEVDLVGTYYYPSFTKEYANRCVMQFLLKKIAANSKHNSIFLQFDWSPVSSSNRDLYLSEQDYKLNLLGYWYTRDVEDAGFTVVRSQNLSISPKYETVSNLEHHPSKRMHAFYATLLANKILKSHLVCRDKKSSTRNVL